MVENCFAAIFSFVNFFCTLVLSTFLLLFLLVFFSFFFRSFFFFFFFGGGGLFVILCVFVFVPLLFINLAKRLDLAGLPREVEFCLNQTTDKVSGIARDVKVLDRDASFGVPRHHASHALEINHFKDGLSALTAIKVVLESSTNVFLDMVFRLHSSGLQSSRPVDVSRVS